MIGILLIVAIALIIVVLMKGKHAKHKLGLLVTLGIIGVLTLGYFMALYGKDINYNTLEGLQQAGTLYFNWFVGSFNNVKSLTGNAVKMDWSGSNATIDLSKTPTSPQTNSLKK